MVKPVRPRPRAKKNAGGIGLKWNLNNNVLLLGVAAIAVVLGAIMALRIQEGPVEPTKIPAREKPSASRSWKLLECVLALTGPHVHCWALLNRVFDIHPGKGVVSSPLGKQCRY